MIEINFKSYGEGKPVVILHGLLGSLDNWVSISKSLSKNFKIIILDLPDHGKSPHTTRFSYKKIAEQLHFFFEKYSFKNISIIGHSMGGKIGIKYADLFPENLDKLVVVDIANKEYSLKRFEHIFFAINALNNTKIISRSQADLISKNFIPIEGERNFILKNLKRKENYFDWAPNVKLLLNSISTISSEILLKSPIKKEVLIIKGAKSDYINKEDRNRLKESFMNYKINEISNSGHWVHAENPKDFINSVINFLKP
ncbi:MAG: alpha/beta hydrolase [Cytophagia bacterium]|jgi:pimeloyl-ACP methyl ester carboxylesterase|nr:alpha/beta hydrolase [Cytophagia bacterium]|tara:strand:- start:373 stop:1140 length:768 start_codon:yes stop_codon:yes gene_type:complete